MTHPRLLPIIAAMSTLAATTIHAQTPALRASADQSAPELASLVRGLTTTARVLVIGMHPDDEDTQLITWLSRAKHVETAYLSITRGEAGDNVGGVESGNSLGAIRTQEVLAARRIDGAKQYYTRAYDFGSARNVDDVLKRWNRDSIVGDIVAVIRSFRPQVIVAMLPDSVKATDGQHQSLELFVAQAMLGSTSPRFPVDPFGVPWLVSRIYRPGAGLTLETAGYDAPYGKTYAELALESRAQHRSQGLRGITQPAPTQISLRRMELKAEDRNAHDASFFAGIDTTFIRLGREAPAGVGEAILAIRANADSAARVLDVLRPSAMVPFLAEIVRQSSKVRSLLPWCRHPSPSAAPPVLPQGTCEPRVLDVDAAIDLVTARAHAALLAATGVVLEATVDRELIAGEDTVPVTISVTNHGSVPVTFSDVAVWGGDETRMQPIEVAPDSTVCVTMRVHGLPLPHPWWIGSRGGVKRGGDCFDAVVSSVDGLLETDLIPAARTLLAVAIPENIRRTSDVTATISVAGATVTTSLGPIVHRFADGTVGLQNRSVAGIPNATLQFARGLEWLPRNKPVTRAMRVAVKSHSDQEQEFALKVMAPDGMPEGVRVDSLPPKLRLAPHESRELLVQLRGTLRDTARKAVGVVGAPKRGEYELYQSGLKEIQRSYLPPIRMLPASAEWIQPIDITVPPNLTTLYVPGGVDDLASALRQVGAWVVEIESADQLLTVDFSKVATILIGARAFDLRPELLGQTGRLVEFVRNGGTLVVLRGDQPTVTSKLLPFPLALAPVPERVMQPDSPVSILGPSRLLEWPNKISAADWSNWVAERAQLVPTSADARYSRAIEVHDAGEPENRNAILSTKIGKGTIIYTSLTLEQQVAGGIPGGLRLLVNMLSTGLTPR